MSGFSAAVSGLANGIGQGMINVNKGKDDELAYQALMDRKAREESLGAKQSTMNDQVIKEQEYRLQGLQHNMLKQGVTIAKNGFAKDLTDVTNSLYEAQGKMRDVDTGEYSVPQTVTDSIQELNKNYRTTPETQDWINNILNDKYGTLDNPVADIRYDAPSDQIVMTKVNGEDIKMSPLMLNNSLGLTKFQSIKDRKIMEAYAAKSEALYKQNKAKLEEAKITTEAVKANTADKKANLDILVATDKLNKANKTNKVEDLKNSLYDMHKVSHDIIVNPKATKDEVKTIVNSLEGNKAFTDGLTKNKTYEKVIQAKYFSDETQKYSDELKSLVDGAKTGTVDTIEKMFLKYTGKSISEDSKKKLLAAKDLTTRLRLLTMDYLQYKSGAAFGAEELKGYEDALGIMDFNDPAVAKIAIEGAAKYLKTRTAVSVESVPNANEKLLLRYKNGYYDNEPDAKPQEAVETPTDITKMVDTISSREEKVAFLRELKDKYPEKYEAWKKEVTGG